MFVWLVVVICVRVCGVNLAVCAILAGARPNEAKSAMISNKTIKTKATEDGGQKEPVLLVGVAGECFFANLVGSIRRSYLVLNWANFPSRT